MPPLFPELDIFTGGQMTDLPAYTGGSFDGTELLEIVSPGNAQAGVNYAITTAQLGAGLAGLSGNTVIINDGENITSLDPYIVDPLDSRIYINKTVAEPTFIRFGAVADHIVDTLVADSNGLVAASPNCITVTFTGGQQADGNATVLIEASYGGYWFRPIHDLTKWSLGTK